MNRSVLFLSVGALMLTAACAKQENSATSPMATDPAPADQALPPATDSTTTPPVDAGAVPVDPSATPPADGTAMPPPADPNASPPPR
ncbi:MAG: hypothetical protein ABI885_12580 [Gammaproteobacteria bacterium]